MQPPILKTDELSCVTTEEAGRILQMSPRTLERLRLVGGGPRYCKAGRRVLYRRSDLSAWLAARSFESTAEARRAGIR